MRFLLLLDTWILIIVFEISFICELFLWKEN